jgi:cyanophycinase
METERKDRGQTDVQLDSTPFRPEGTLIVIGGNEEKEGYRPILELIAKRARTGKLVVVTIATEEPEEQWNRYQKTFKELGVDRLEQFDARSREELLSQSRPELLDEGTVIFFAGGDQMKITSKFGGTPLCDRMRQLYAQGALIAGTSSGASVMAEVMMAAGEGESSHQGQESVRLAPGLGLISGVIIDQHFAERGRMGRLLGGVAQNPRLLGIGIDEDTALVLRGHEQAAVIGSGAVYIIDGRSITHTNLPESEDEAISVFGATVHVLSSGDRFDLGNRAPGPGRTEDIESELVEVS